MSAVASNATYTPEDLLAMPNEKDFELVDGKLVERNMGALASWVGCELAGLIRDFLKSDPIGLLFGADTGYQCFSDAPARLRRPDVSFVRNGRLPGNVPPDGLIRIAPDLAVEVMSRNDVVLDVDQKLEDYLRAGVPLVWLVNPNLHVVHVYRANGSANYLHEGDELTGEDVLPGFRCQVSDLFPPHARTAAGKGA
jgi:Uma2 family endonuclease